MNTCKRIKIENGLRVLLVPQKQSLTAMVMVLVEAGSKYETRKINGISHFLEHMCFKGTTNRPNPLQISSELDSLGASYNASTSQEFTNYFAKAKYDATPDILEIITDLYANPIFAEEEIEKEKGVIVEEIHMYEDLPARRVQEVFMKLVYGDQPAGWDIAGDEKTVRLFKREDFVNYRKEHYLPQSTILVVSGKFSEKRIVKDIQKYFSSLRRGVKTSKKRVVERQLHPQEEIVYKDSDQSHLVMGFRAFGVHDKRRFALQVLSDILGGGMSSRLWQKIREELGAAYYIRSDTDFYSDHGLLTMSAGVNHEKIREVITVALQEFIRFVKEPVSLHELAKAKDHITGNLYISLETSDEVGSFYGAQEVMGIPLATPETVSKKISMVTPADIQSVAREIVRNDRLNMALIGPFRGKKFSDIVRV